MTADQILALGPELAKFLEEFADCFVRWNSVSNVTLPRSQATSPDGCFARKMWTNRRSVWTICAAFLAP